MPYRIFNWSQISNKFSDSILLGNGASISIGGRFTYSSLKEHAVENGLVMQGFESLFSFFDTNDLELVLRLVWQENKVTSTRNPG